MRVFRSDLLAFLPQLTLDTASLAGMLSMIGHESEVINDGELEVKVFPSRGDVLSLRGLTRDLAALRPEVGEWVDCPVAQLPEPTDFFSLTIDPRAQRYVYADHLILLSNYRPTASPEKIRRLLRPLGLQPKDLLVDLTNIITYETGQPLHAFDFESIAAGMTLDLSRSGESFVALNNKKIELESDLLIARHAITKDVVDLVGTIGGKNSSAQLKSGKVLIQAAAFEPSIIRRNSRSTGITTEASYRYQRGVDPALPNLALARFALLLKEALPSISIDAYQSFSNVPVATEIALDRNYVSRLLGHEVPTTAIDTLDNLGFRIKGSSVIPPSWRFDITCPADIAEEIGRIIGLDAITPTPLGAKSGSYAGEFWQVLGLKRALVEQGLTETMTYSFVENGFVTLQDPRTDDQKAMRTNLRTGILSTLARNPYLHKAAFFEIGNVFTPDESTHIGVGVTGRRESAIRQLESTLKEMCGLSLTFEQVDPTELARFDVKQAKVFYGELPVKMVEKRFVYLPNRDMTIQRFTTISKYPPIVRDITIVVDKTIDSSVVTSHCLANDAILIAELVDRFESTEKLGEEKVALTFRLFVQSIERTLRDEEATKIIEQVFHTLSDTVPFEIR